MPLHPDAARAIAQAGDLPAQLEPAELRRVYHEQRIGLVGDALPIASSAELEIPGRGGPIPARHYVPLASAAGAPLMVFLHGGGWMLGNLEGYDAICRRLAAKARCVVVSVGYRLAPEHPFPAAVDDSWDALAWCASHAQRLGGDARNMIVCGDSAGGNLAATLAQMDLDSGERRITLQALIYPSTDMSRPWPSYERNATGYMLTASALEKFFRAYVRVDKDREDPRASPMRRPSLAGLAPAVVISAEFDPLVDDNHAYAERLARDGVAVDHVCFPGMIHPFFTLGRIVRDAEKAEDLIAAAVARHCESPTFAATGATQ
jgi:acetyl esterase